MGTNSNTYHTMASAIFVELEPRDAIEAMLIAHMTATHTLMTTLAGRAFDATNFQVREAQERSMTCLSRTYLAQMDAIKKYRAKAQQTVRVERVTVHEGGQAIVGDVNHGVRVAIKSDGSPMQSAHMAPSCTAHSKRSGILCKNPAVLGWAVYRMHGAGGGQSSGAANSQWVHGLREANTPRC